MKKVFVLEDDDQILKSINLLLLQNGYYPILASSTDLLSDTIQIDKPDVILLDVGINAASGRAICKKIKQDPLCKNIPIILYSTAKNKLKNYQRCLADGILEEPMNINKLLSVVKLGCNNMVNSAPIHHHFVGEEVFA